MPSESEGLTRRVAAGVGWSYIGLVVGFGLQLVYTAVMARLLAPADFGAVAGALIGLRFVTYLSRFGLGSAVVQRQSISADELKIAFSVSIIVAALATGVAVALSGPLAVLIEQPEVSSVMRWMALSIFVGAASAVPEALLRRQLRFRLLATAQVAASAVGFLAVGIPLAVHGAGVWSLVAASASQGLVTLLTVTWVARECVRWRFDRYEARRMLSFGGWVAATGFLEFLGSSIDTFAVGRWLGAPALGQYSRATYLVGLPLEQATTATSRVLLPSLAQVQDDQARFRRGLLGGVGLLSPVVLAAVGIASFAAPALVGLLLGPGWTDAAGVLPYVGVAYGLSMLTHLPAVAAEAKGLVRRKFGIQVAVVLVFVAAVAVVIGRGASLSSLGLAWVMSELFRAGCYLVFVVPLLGVRRHELLTRYGAAVVVAAFASSPAWLLVRHFGSTSTLALLVAGLLGVALGFLALALPAGRLLRNDALVVIGQVRRRSIVLEE